MKKKKDKKEKKNKTSKILKKTGMAVGAISMGLMLNGIANPFIDNTVFAQTGSSDIVDNILEDMDETSDVINQNTVTRERGQTKEELNEDRTRDEAIEELETNVS